MTDNQESHLKEQEFQPRGSSDGVSLHIESKTFNRGVRLSQVAENLKEA